MQKEKLFNYVLEGIRKSSFVIRIIVLLQQNIVYKQRFLLSYLQYATCCICVPCSVGNG